MTYFDISRSLESESVPTIDILSNTINGVPLQRSPTAEPPMTNTASPGSAIRHRIGNNIYGAAGTKKCSVCRIRKARVSSQTIADLIVVRI